MFNQTNSTYLLQFVYSIEIVVLPMLILFGSLCNIMTFIVMRRRRMRGSSTCFYMAALAIADTLVLWTGCLNQWLYLIHFPTFVVKSNLTCKLLPFIFIFFADISVWIVVCMSIERYLAVSRPLKASQMCTTRRAKCSLLVVLIIFVLIDGHYLLTLQIQEIAGTRVCHPQSWARHFVGKIYVFIDALKYSVIPFCILLVMSILIIQRVFHAQTISKQLQNLRHLNSYQQYSLSPTPSLTGRSSSTGINSSQTKSLNSMRIGRRVTCMLLSVSIAFCIFSAPMSLMQIVQSIVTPEYDEVLLAIGKAVAELCQYINHSCNFFLYALTGRVFRREFIRVFFPTRFGGSAATAGVAARMCVPERVSLIPPAMNVASSHHDSIYSADNLRPNLCTHVPNVTKTYLKQSIRHTNKQNNSSVLMKTGLPFDKNLLLSTNRYNFRAYGKSPISTMRNSDGNSSLYTLWSIMDRRKQRRLTDDGLLLFVTVTKQTNAKSSSV